MCAYYNPETLKKLQKIELDMLKDFDMLCDKYNIDYFGCGGTTIGLLRHNGFIPWDDDIDVGMLRKDFDKFLKVAEKEYGNKYSILNFETNHAYPLMTTRWIKNGTTFLEYGFKNINANWGIFLDIFCFDNVPDTPKEFKKQGFWAWFWGKLLILRSVPKPVLEQHGFISYCIWGICRIINFLFRLLHIPPEFFYKKAKKQILKYKNENTKRVAYMFDPKLYTSVLNKSDILPTSKREYNGIPVRFMKNVEAYCKVRYGDYMTLPPEDRRHNHVPYKLDFGNEQGE